MQLYGRACGVWKLETAIHRTKKWNSQAHLLERSGAASRKPKTGRSVCRKKQPRQQLVILREHDADAAFLRLPNVLMSPPYGGGPAFTSSGMSALEVLDMWISKVSRSRRTGRGHYVALGSSAFPTTARSHALCMDALLDRLERADRWLERKTSRSCSRPAGIHMARTPAFLWRPVPRQWSIGLRWKPRSAVG